MLFSRARWLWDLEEQNSTAIVNWLLQIKISTPVFAFYKDVVWCSSSCGAVFWEWKWFERMLLPHAWTRKLIGNRLYFPLGKDWLCRCTCVSKRLQSIPMVVLRSTFVQTLSIFRFKRWFCHVIYIAVWRWWLLFAFVFVMRVEHLGANQASSILNACLYATGLTNYRF